MLWQVIAWFQLPAPFPLLAVSLLYQKHNKTSQANPSTNATCECAASYSYNEMHTPYSAFPAARPENCIDKLMYVGVGMTGVW